jgi:hypothetical protein
MVIGPIIIMIMIMMIIIIIIITTTTTTTDRVGLAVRQVFVIFFSPSSQIPE